MGISQYRTAKALFSEEEEQALFKELKETTHLAKRNRILSKIVMNFTPLVYKIQRQLSGYNLDADDLIGEGNLGLTEAACRFDIDNGNRFSAYAISWIRGVMMAYITRNFAIVNYCTDATKKSLFFHLRRVISAEQKKQNCFDITPALLDSIAFKLDVPLSEIQSILAMFQTRYDGLDQPIRNGEETGTRLDLVQDQSIDQEQSLIERDRTVHQQSLIRAGMASAKLSPREIMILESQYLVDNRDRVTLEELGEELNISKERVRQIRNKAYIRLSRGVKRSARDMRINVFA